MKTQASSIICKGSVLHVTSCDACDGEGHRIEVADCDYGPGLRCHCFPACESSEVEIDCASCDGLGETYDADCTDCETCDELRAQQDATNLMPMPEVA